jgi:PX domain-containing protein kinase-like protein
MISKESLKSNFATMEQVLSHQFFTEFAQSYKKSYAEFEDSMKRISSADLNGRDLVATIVQRTEQRLKDEQKLVIQKILRHVTCHSFIFITCL